MGPVWGPIQPVWMPIQLLCMNYVLFCFFFHFKVHLTYMWVYVWDSKRTWDLYGCPYSLYGCPYSFYAWIMCYCLFSFYLNVRGGCIWVFFLDCKRTWDLYGWPYILYGRPYSLYAHSYRSVWWVYGSNLLIFNMNYFGGLYFLCLCVLLRVWGAVWVPIQLVWVPIQAVLLHFQPNSGCPFTVCVKYVMKMLLFAIRLCMLCVVLYFFLL